MVYRRTLRYDMLLLDQRNPRHVPVETQAAALRVMLSSLPEKIKNLALHLAENGPSPIDSLLVLPENGRFVVLEGNRRLAAMKLLHEPDLVQDHGLTQTFRDIADRVNQLPSTFSCVVADSREEAQKWQELRHGGEQGGIGIVRWGSEASQRFYGCENTHASKALLVLDQLADLFSNDEPFREGISYIKEKKLTTFGRLVSDPYVRRRLQFTIDRGRFSWLDDPTITRQAFLSLLDDFREITVSNIKSKRQRQQYINRLLGTAEQTEDGADQSNSSKSSEGESKDESERKRQPHKNRILTDLTLRQVEPRVMLLLKEIQELNTQRYPNTMAIGMRTIIEAVINAAIARHNLTKKRKLRDNLKLCLRIVDPSRKDRRFQAVRTGLADPNSMMSAIILHAWVHNANFSPSPSDIVAVANNWLPFLEALDES